MSGDNNRTNCRYTSTLMSGIHILWSDCFLEFFINSQNSDAPCMYLFCCIHCNFWIENCLIWHAVFSLEKTFKTTFSLLILHMWLVLRRLKEEGKEGVELGQYMYETYNHDLELRVSKAGVSYPPLSVACKISRCWFYGTSSFYFGRFHVW